MRAGTPAASRARAQACGRTGLARFQQSRQAFGLGFAPALAGLVQQALGGVAMGRDHRHHAAAATHLPVDLLHRNGKIVGAGQDRAAELENDDGVTHGRPPSRAPMRRERSRDHDRRRWPGADRPGSRPGSPAPTDRRINPSLMPSCARRSAGTAAWVMLALWVTRVSTAPRFSAGVHRRRVARVRTAASRPPASSKTTRPPPACCWAAATSRPRKETSSGWRTQLMWGSPSRARAISRAWRDWVCRRRGRVFRPCRVSQAL